MSASIQDPKLHSLGGRPAPFDIKFDLNELFLAAEAAGDDFWALLAAGVAEVPAAGLQEAIAALSEKHNVTADRVGRALRVCRLLFREGARRNVDVAALSEDLAASAPRIADALGAALLPRYQQLAPELRREILYGALTDHGRLLTGVSWRIDEMKLCQRGADLKTPVVLLTLTFVEGTEQKRVTVQALPDMVNQLRAMCDSVG